MHEVSARALLYVSRPREWHVINGIARHAIGADRRPMIAFCGRDANYKLGKHRSWRCQKDNFVGMSTVRREMSLSPPPLGVVGGWRYAMVAREDGRSGRARETAFDRGMQTFKTKLAVLLGAFCWTK